jgi:uncharacterized lipoprotein YmbA
MTQRGKRLFSITFLFVAASGCGASPAARFYTLSSTAKVDGGTAAYAVGVGPVTIPSAVDRPQIVVQVAPNRVEIDEFSRWAAPLDESIARAVAGNLAILLGTPDVVVAPLASLTPEFRVSIDVQRFDSTRAESVVVDAVWRVRRAAGEEARSGRTLAREAVEGDSIDALAAAHGRALARLSADIAAAIRELAARKGGS